MKGCELESTRLFLTGDPGVGKSTIFLKVVEELRKRECRVGGFSAPEVRSHNLRVGFKIVDLVTGEEGWLARAGAQGRLRVGKYVVIEEDASKIGVKAIERALKECHVVAIDEIGPMELLVESLKNAIERAIASGKLYLAVVHRRLHEMHPSLYRTLISQAPIVKVTYENRDLLAFCSSRYAELIASRACL
ncbi:MAG: NTPase [Acidilobaceae archaeon]